MAVKVGIFGAGGRMGRMLLREALSRQGCVLSAAVERAGSAELGRDAAALAGLAADSGVRVTEDAAAALEASDVMIDFTAPVATVEHAALAARHGKALVVGTTGLSAVEEASLAAAAQKAPVFHSANMSVGVSVLAAVVEQLAKRLSPEDYDIEIFEAHHRHKVDAPSGTALLLGRAAAAGRGVRLDDAMAAARHGHTGPRVAGSIGMSVFRGGDVAGDHTVTFAGEGERVELTHRASDRAIFARGALRAALWLKGRPPGLYGMKDLLEV